MSKKDYERLALAIQEAHALADSHPAYSPTHAIGLTAECIAHALASDSPSFDRARFLAACDPGANVRARGSKAGA